jgi:Ca2+-binding RTX toxin-like protein
MQVLNVPFQVIGGDPKVPHPDVNSTVRNVTIEAKTSTDLEMWDGNKVWLLIPGFTAPSDSLDSRLVSQIKTANPRDTILTLDWEETSDSSDGAAGGIRNGDLYRSVSWVTPLAEAIVKKLYDEWGVSSFALNIIGHSIGAYAANEIAFRFNQAVGRIGSLTALDPASNFNRRSSPFDNANGYDTDLRNGYTNNRDARGRTPDPIKPFTSSNAVISRSFNGALSVAGNESQSGTAKESFIIDFNGQVRTDLQHPAVIDVFSKIITTTTIDNVQYSRLARNFLSTSDTLSDHLFSLDTYSGFAVNSVQVHEAVIASNANSDPLFVVAQSAIAPNGILIYTTNADDVIDVNKINGNEDFANKYYKDSQQRVYYLGEGNDSFSGEFRGGPLFFIPFGNTVHGDGGNDTITGFEGDDFYFGGNGNDRLVGGKGNDTLIGDAGNDRLLGDEGKDLLIGGIGSDSLFGGSGFNTLEGFAKNPDGTIIYPDKERDILVHSANSQNIFILSSGSQNAYNQRFDDDYAGIFGYEPFKANGQGGDLIVVSSRLSITIGFEGINNTLISQRSNGDVIAIIDSINPLEVILRDDVGLFNIFGALG